MHAITYRASETPSLINSQWLLNAVRSQLHFSQLSAWLARLHARPEHRRRVSREQCNYKKMEANRDIDETEQRKLNIVYSIQTPGESKPAEFAKPPTDHTFPVTDIGNNTYLKITLESLPRLDDIPTLRCTCQTQKRRPSKDIPANVHEELVGKLNDLSIGSRKYDGAINSNIGTPNRRLSIISNPGSTEYLFTAVDKEKLVDDRMLTPCSENGKHKCNCDDESDGNKDSVKDKQPPKKLDERRLKEIAKYKRRIRKEKMKKLCESTSSEGDGLKSKETTSIPILQASRFDRFRAIGCYRNQTYLTLPATRIETKSPFIETDVITPPDFKKTCTVGTQTDDCVCRCGKVIDLKCDHCERGMVRSDGNYNLASLTDDKREMYGRRKLDNLDNDKTLKKHKCDTSIKCDNVNSNVNDGLIKRPKLRRAFPIVDRLDKVVHDRHLSDTQSDIRELHLNTDDSVFSVPKESKRQKTFSISDDDYVLYEKCDYGTIDQHDIESPKDEYSPDFKFADPQREDFKEDSFESNDSLESLKHGFVFPDPKKGDDSVPTSTEMDKFRYRFSSATSMVFPGGGGVPLTSSPAPLRRNSTCFQYDDNINSVHGIKSALFHPISPRPSAPCSPPATPRPPSARKERSRLRMGPSNGLLGSFEESALQGRLEAVATVHGFTAELGASGAFCPPHKRFPVTVFFYAPGGTNAPYMGHIDLGPGGYRVAPSGTVQVSLFNPHGTLVKMFVVLYALGAMPPGARTFLRQRTLYMPPGAPPPASPRDHHRWLRYLIHLRFMTSKSGKLYLHTDIRLIVSRKADLDTATAHSALFRPLPTKKGQNKDNTDDRQPSGRAPNRVFGGSSEIDSDKSDMRELGYENQNGVSYELRSFTYAPDNPKYSPR